MMQWVPILAGGALLLGGLAWAWRAKVLADWRCRQLEARVQELGRHLATAESLTGLAARLAAILSTSSHTESLLSRIILVLSGYLPDSTVVLVLFDAARGIEVTADQGGPWFLAKSGLDGPAMDRLTTPGARPAADWAFLPGNPATPADRVLNIPVLNEGYYAGSFLIIGGQAPDARFRLLLTDLSSQIAAAFRDILQHRENAWIKDRFGTLVDPRVRDHLLDRRLPLGPGELREVTVLFLDIRNFTSFSENRAPAEVLAFLNQFFSRMEDCIHATGGLINKFTGDGFLAVFGAPEPMPDHGLRALQAALLMRQSIARHYSDGSLRVGMGIAGGPVAAGRVGSARRMEYSVIGDVVNLASRLEGMSKLFGAWMVFDQGMLDRLDPGLVRSRPLGRVQVKGRSGAGLMHELLACRTQGLPPEVQPAGGEWLSTPEGLLAWEHQAGFVRGLEAWFRGDFAGVLELMDQLARACPADRAVAHYQEQARRHLGQPVPPGWDGTLGSGR